LKCQAVDRAASTRVTRSFLAQRPGADGISEQAIGLLGTAALLPVRDTRLHLNGSKTLAIEFQDVMDDARALFLEFKRHW
jgi:hypothetical protein